MFVIRRIIVRYILKQKGNITNPRHVLYGGMAEGASRTFVVPKLSSGKYVNVLTDDEKDFLEDAMGLEPNALSIYKKVDNFWDDSNPLKITRVRLTKLDSYLDLSSPEDYIKYKILLAIKIILPLLCRHCRIILSNLSVCFGLKRVLRISRLQIR